MWHSTFVFHKAGSTLLGHCPNKKSRFLWGLHVPQDHAHSSSNSNFEAQKKSGDSHLIFIRLLYLRLSSLSYSPLVPAHIAILLYLYLRISHILLKALSFLCCLLQCVALWNCASRCRSNEIWFGWILQT